MTSSGTNSAMPAKRFLICTAQGHKEFLQILKDSSPKNKRSVNGRNPQDPAKDQGGPTAPFSYYSQKLGVPFPIIRMEAISSKAC